MLRIEVLRSAQELCRLRPAWQKLTAAADITIFQDFDWNLLAAQIFAGREAPHVVWAHSSYGEAIIPAVLRHDDAGQTLRLLGEEMFDYRTFLHAGDDAVLRCALARLSEFGCPLQITALRQSDVNCVSAFPSLTPFTRAPRVARNEVSAEEFSQHHLRLARNLRRMERLGFELKAYDGSQSRLLQKIYQNKAEQEPASLFRDPLRRQFMERVATLAPHRIEVFTLEGGSRLGAALVTLLDPGVRRFYTCWFSDEISKHSPALSLIYEVTKRSLADGLDCDYMTGEQDYKLRLAISSVQLFRLHATAEQLESLANPSAQEMKLAS
ncbi:MAG TPA: GNAT family N-acetyltransferase [Candidatus Angelobacter sp.]|nr:GNAT family N-acetyltransferase [Candidatus Angelobacter sp.]